MIACAELEEPTVAATDPQSATAMVTVDTMIKGALDVPLSSVMTFVSPMLGFEHLRRFIVFQSEPGPLYWLQSIEDRRSAFCLIAPFEAGMDPDMTIGASDAALIGAAAASDIKVYTVVVLDADPAQMRTNLAAPILINHAAGLATQLVLEDKRLPVRYYLSQLKDKARPSAVQA